MATSRRCAEAGVRALLRGRAIARFGAPRRSLTVARSLGGVVRGDGGSEAQGLQGRDAFLRGGSLWGMERPVLQDWTRGYASGSGIPGPAA